MTRRIGEMEDIDSELLLLADLTQIEIGRREKRPLCNSCSRPVEVCWCRSLGRQRVESSCRVVVLQHPHEEKRCLRTAPILQAALPQGLYMEVKGKRFPFSRFPQLEEIFFNENSVLMYPGDRAVNLENLPPVGDDQLPYNIIIIDGTWQQAKSMYHNCHHLHNLRQVRVSGKFISEYVIRTQPTEDALSTVETAAIALATLEQNWSIYDTLVKPLQLLCQYQIKHGAVPHQSKEQMIVSGRCKKPLGKRTFKKLRKCGAKQGDTLSDFMDSLSLSGNQLNIKNVRETGNSVTANVIEIENKEFNHVNATAQEKSAVHDQSNDNAHCHRVADRNLDEAKMLSHHSETSSNDTINLPYCIR